MQRLVFGAGRTALALGEQKINLHRHGHEFEPKTRRPTPGSAELRFITRTPRVEAMPILQPALFRYLKARYGAPLRPARFS